MSNIFQSTHPSGVRPAGSVALTVPCEFQSTHPSGVRLARGPEVRRNADGEFQSTHPSGVRQSSKPPNTASGSNFNPRTPVGCDLDAKGQQLGDQIQISIHAPQWGATRNTWARTISANDFNPRTPVGCDIIPCSFPYHGAISIHAPQWGATYLLGAFVADWGISIHAPQWGATRITYK